MATLTRLAFLLLAATLNQKVLAQWEAPYFVAPPPGPGNVVFTPDAQNPLIVESLFDEEIENGPVILAVMTYTGDQAPTVIFSTGQEETLGLVLRQDSGLGNKWVIEATLEQNYESTFKLYVVEIYVPGVRGYVTLKVRNLNDNSPVFVITNSDCTVQEDFLGETECVFTLRDEDEILAANAVINVEPSNLFALTPPVQNGAQSVTTKLRVLEALDYETAQLHLLTLTASDGANDAQPQFVIMRINDVADQIPIWTNPLPPIIVIDEEEAVNRDFGARDGDSGASGAPLEFELVTGDATFFSVSTVDGTTGRLSIAAIDRDAGQDQFTIRVRAKEVGNPTSAIEADVQVMVNDINDNIPTITPATLEATLVEGFSGNIEFPEIKVSDLDLGASGQYNVELVDSEAFGWGAAFRVVPNSGYQDTIFTISVIDSSKLNFEDANWRTINLELKATEVSDETRTQSVPITITVTDSNDETPTFDSQEYAVDVNEIAPINTEILTVVATDGDAGDTVTYAILTSTTAVKIDPATGVISTNRENPFDFETQSQIIIQVAATDSENHRSIVQVTMTVLDSNDSPPTLSLPNDQLVVQENTPADTLITQDITATDPDSSANLEFSIDWTKTYATNKGVRVADASIYTDCVKITTEAINGDNGDVRAILETTGVIFDFEKFDALYLNLVATDKDQAQNAVREATLNIGVSNDNDNPPKFETNTLLDKSVAENSVSGQLIGYIVATDPDMIDPITYEIQSGDENSPLEWVTITDGGQILTTDVKINKEAASVLKYKIIARDSSSESEEIITINVIDVNDEAPVFDAPGGPFTIDENSPDGTVIATVSATDGDVDAPYKKLQYELNLDYPDLGNYFAVDGVSGEVTVKKRSGYELDRDRTPFGVYTIELIVRDNTPPTAGYPSDSLQGRTSFVLNLNDVNDEPPTFDNAPVTIDIDEDIGLDGVIYTGVSAPDLDAEGPFSTVTYEIMNVVPAPPSGGDMFKLVNADNKANILAARDLRGLYNTYLVTIKATDGGGLFDEKDFTINVNDLNDNSPTFVWPSEEGFQIRVSANQTIGTFLNGEDDQPLPEVQGSDLDSSNSPNGRIDFSITGDDIAIQYLNISTLANNKARLVVKELFPDEGLTQFPLTLLARDQATDFKETPITGMVFIINLSEEPPIFIGNNDQTFEWEENDATVAALLPKATDANNDNMEPENKQLIYYNIIEGDEDGAFTINHEVVEYENIPTIALKDPTGEGLDSDDGPSVYTLKVLASNTPSAPSEIKDPRSVITVTINVLDVPDSLPSFAEELYVGGIAPADVTGVEVIRITATDSDENDPTTYRIVPGSMSASEPYLEEVMDTAFTLESTTGSLKTNFIPQDYMKGYFSFKVEATDTNQNSATTDVQIYIINKSNRVEFLFANRLSDVDAQRDFIDEVFTRNLEFECAIEYVFVPENVNDTTVVTSVRTHFVDPEQDLPVEGSVIEARAANIETLTSMRNELQERSLYLYDVTSNRQPEENNTAAILATTLIVVSVVLGALVVILLIAFVVKTKSLNRRLEALSTTRFGSQESGLNRIAMNVPNTNKHAIEGSNPVWNEDVPNYDNNSQGSGDSDLIGIEDRPEFGYKDNQGFQGGSYGDFYGGGADGSPVGGQFDHPDTPATYL